MSGKAERRSGGGRRRGPAARLRREALADRPAFSEAFHQRLVERMAGLRQPVPGLREAASRDRRWTVPVGVTVAMLFAAVGVSMATRPPTGDRGASTVRQAASPTDAGVERLPMFDEIESEVVDGIGAMAAEFVGLPPWGDLAAFDVRSLLASDDTPR